MADEDHMVTSRWPSGLVWHYTVFYPTVLGLNAEILFLYVGILYIRSSTYLKAVLVFTVILIIAKFLGLTLVGLFRKWNQWRIGPYRNIYCNNDNKLRFLKGF